MKLLLLLSLMIYIPFMNAQIVIVTNKNSNIHSLSKESIKYLYLAKVNKINSIKIKALLSNNKVLHKKFITNIIDKNIHQYRSYWARLVFTGREPIPRRLNYKEIIKELNHLNTIIYIDKKDITSNWKIIYEE